MLRAWVAHLLAGSFATGRMSSQFTSLAYCCCWRRPSKFEQHHRLQQQQQHQVDRYLNL